MPSTKPRIKRTAKLLEDKATNFSNYKRNLSDATNQYALQGEELNLNQQLIYFVVKFL